ncbi:hypothetical protein CXF80_11705 [Shewanella sp. Actino-trap-3]|uniref:hypothetical protein n=1 Tax=Shewanella sp. Actino-trap-3 TaxID=2058331 RepID=UPI000C33AC4F|nr:hypothetical protein [Shewanella sp. Actino-trap-3]PKG78918.1 hypothetical protein CXF80_11705 [Shewanella sp. Actino-trap-3]
MKNSDIYKYISCDDDESRKAFIKDFEEELKELSKIFSDAFNLLENSPCNQDPSTRASTVSGYIFLAIESAVTATQLLVLGHIAPAGNSMRISYESLCYSALLKKEIKLVVANGKHKFDFYDDYVKKKSHTRADKVIDVVVKNKDGLGLNQGGVDFLVGAKKFYNGYSHASFMLLHSKIKPSTRQLYIAGGYENERLEIFKEQLKFIKRYSKNLNGWIQAVAYNAT